MMTFDTAPPFIRALSSHGGLLAIYVYTSQNTWLWDTRPSKFIVMNSRVDLTEIDVNLFKSSYSKQIFYIIYSFFPNLCYTHQNIFHIKMLQN